MTTWEDRCRTKIGTMKECVNQTISQTRAAWFGNFTKFSIIIIEWKCIYLNAHITKSKPGKAKNAKRKNKQHRCHIVKEISNGYFGSCRTSVQFSHTLICGGQIVHDIFGKLRCWNWICCYGRRAFGRPWPSRLAFVKCCTIAVAHDWREPNAL